MSFEAKRLRVQLPCDPGGTVIEEGAQQAAHLCPLPSFCICTAATPCRQFMTNACLCTHLTPCHYYGTCRYGTGGCQHFVTCVDVNSGICQYGSACGPLASLCEIPSACGPSAICPGGSRQPGPDPGPLVIDAEQLPALREALEAQLKEIEKAEQALKERGGGE